jgi:hypothetical protein
VHCCDASMKMATATRRGGNSGGGSCACAQPRDGWYVVIVPINWQQLPCCYHGPFLCPGSSFKPGCIRPFPCVSHASLWDDCTDQCMMEE